MRIGVFNKLGDISETQQRDAFLELAGSRYSCRMFERRQVSSLKLGKILEAARLAPSACNQQPVHLWTLTSEEALARIRPIHTMFDAPVVIMVGHKADEAWVRKCDGKRSAETDAAIVGTHIILAAADLGLGCTWVGSFDPSKVKEAFPETDGYEISALFAVGYPHPKALPSDRHAIRKSLDEFNTSL